MATWPKEPRLLGTEVPRVDGLAKASGRAKYPSDERPQGMLFTAVLYSPHAHARVKSIDTAAAEKLPGVKAIEVLTAPNRQLRYHGDDIAIVAAETEEQARDGARAIQVEYEVLDHMVTEDQARQGGAQAGPAQTNGNPDLALGEAAAIVEGVYSVPVITHCCLEPHGLTARWDGDDKVTIWASTQNVFGLGGPIAEAFGIPQANVTVLTDFMGGGFGSKFNPDVWGIAAARLAKKTGRPVGVYLDREQELCAAGNRPGAAGKITIGADKSGKITVFVAETAGTGGRLQLPYVYAAANTRSSHNQLRLNTGGTRAWRAPNHPQMCALTEMAVDDLAEKLGIDPLELRLRSLKDNDPVGGGVNRTPIYRDELRIGSELIGWKDKYKKRGARTGVVRRGVGLGMHQWGGGPGAGMQVECNIHPDGSVEVKTATQDLGTGIRTVLAVIAAEVLGLEPTDITSKIGNSSYPPGKSSGGSTTTPSMAPPCYTAVGKARDEFLKRIAGALEAEPGDLELKDKKVVAKGGKGLSWKDACRRLGTMPVSVTAEGEPGLASTGVGGCQFAEVEVDTETGVVKLIKIVAVQDSGLIIDMLTWRSQVYGGVIMGLNAALFEEQLMDPVSGRVLNPDMELYKLAGATDIPEIVVEAYHTPEMRARGVIGVGEPPVISTMAAIANATANALGVRVPHLPMTPMNVLNALASKGA